MRVKLEQSLHGNQHGTVTEMLDSSQFSTDIAETAIFFYNKSRSSDRHNRCLSPVGQGDRLWVGEDLYIFVSQFEQGIPLPGVPLNLKKVK